MRWLTKFINRTVERLRDRFSENFLNISRKPVIMEIRKRAGSKIEFAKRNSYLRREFLRNELWLRAKAHALTFDSDADNLAFWI